MAFSNAKLTELMTVLGKYINAVNSIETLNTTYAAADTDLATILESQNFLEYYAPIPDMVDNFQDGLSSWISTLITDSKNIFLNRTKVLEELTLSSYTFDDVIEAIHLYMLLATPTQYILDSLITINLGTDQGYCTPAASGSTNTARVIASTIMSGTQSPKAGFAANTHYNNIRSELATPDTITAKCISASAIGSEVIQLYGSAPYTAPYTKNTENPGPGPSLQNIHNHSQTSNWDFTNWTNDTPTGWTMSGGVSGTDWEKVTGPPDYLQINTDGVTISQEVSSLSPGITYVYGIYWKPVALSGNVSLTLYVNDQYVASGSKAWDTTDFATTFFYSIPETDSTTPTITLTPTLGATDDIKIYKVVVAPATYYNGLAWAAWSPDTFNTGAAAADTEKFKLNDEDTIAIANDNAGLVQTYFRKAFKTQLPTDSTPTVPESVVV